jgi:hypothetical protein
MTWKSILSFIVSATLLILLSGWLISANLLPIQTELSYSQGERSFVQIWLSLAIAIGLIIPGVGFLMWRQRPTARTILGFYLLVLAIQILTELIFSRIFFTSLLVIIGSIYTAFRVWHLWQSQQFVRGNAGERVMDGLLWLLLLFWSANLIFLLVLGWLKILEI